MEEDRLEYVERLGVPAGDVYYHLLQEMWRLTTGWQVYRALFGKNEDSYKLLASALDECFWYLESSLFNETLLRIRKITEKPKNRNQTNICVRRLMEFMHGEDAIELERLISDAEAARRGVKFRADKVVAHFDEETAFGRGHGTGLSRKQVTEAIDKVGDAIKFFSEKKLNTDVMLNPLGLHSPVEFLVTVFEGTQARTKIRDKEHEDAKQHFNIVRSRWNSYPAWLTEELVIPIR